ncbi:MAG TPA: C4-type zinc ribbon domain-containing protein [Acidimicrobiales bacterium]|nr:C4-type zinc ribbon domain-containing protein [Acidimicrobiales bacterium]
MTATDDLQSLLHLQHADTRADQLNHRRENLPERAALADIDHRIGQAEAALVDAVSARDIVAEKQRELEADLASAEDRASAVNRRLYSGEVSASRELQAMAADVDALKERSSELEDSILEVLEELEPLEKQASELESALSGLRTERAAAASSLAATESVVDSELAAVDSERQQIAAAVPESLLRLYEQLRARLGGVAVASLVGSRCDGCHLSLPATELDRIRHLPAGEMVTCDQCGRILVLMP